MILYLDASALVKRYLAETGSEEVIALTGSAAALATAVISRAEVAAALARAVRLGVLDRGDGERTQRRFARDWPNVIRIPITEALVARAETLAWNQSLRGYDAVQLAAALAWQDSIGEEVILATFDHQLWEATFHSGLHPWPEKLPRGSRA